MDGCLATNFCLRLSSGSICTSIDWSATAFKPLRQHHFKNGIFAKSIRLAFVRAHVAAGGFRSPGTRQAALIDLQKAP